MTIQVYESKAKSAVLTGLPQEAIQRPMDITNTGDQMATKEGLKAAAVQGETMQKEEEQRQATDLVNASNEYSMATLEYEKEYKLTHQGKDARNTVPDYQAWHKEKAAEFGKNLPNNARMTALWAKTAGQVMTGSTSRGNQHSYNQELVYRKDETAKLTTLLMEKVTLNYDNPKVLDASMANYKAAVLAVNPDLDQTANFAAVESKVAQTAIQTAIHHRNIELAELMLYGDPELKDKDGKRTDHGYSKILGESLPTVVGRVKALRVDVEAIRLTDEIADDPALISKQDKFDKLDELAVGQKFEEDVIKAGRQYIHRDHSYDKEILESRKKEIEETYMGRITRATSPEESFQIVQDLIAMPMDEGLRARLLAKARRGIPHAVKDDAEALAKYRAEAPNLTAEQAYNKYKPFFTKETMDGIVAVKKKKGSKRVEDYGIAFSLELEKMYRSKSALERKTNVHAMTSAMDAFVNDYLDRNQELPTKEEMDAYKATLLTEEIYDYGRWDWGDRSIQRGLITTLEAEDVDVDNIKYVDVPTTEVNAIKQMFIDKNIGRVPTQDEIVELYTKGLIDRTR